MGPPQKSPVLLEKKKKSALPHALMQLSRSTFCLLPPGFGPTSTPQKAIRVDTPPLKEDTADGKPRGLFFDVSGPSDAGLNDSGAGGSESTSTRASKKETHKNEAQGLSEPKRRREWWDPYPKTLAAATTTAASRRDLIRKAAAFEFDVPEHLPNSPMCPANPKHKSGGKGVCVYHGRRKSSYRERGSAGNSLRHSPRNSPGTQVQKRRSSGGSSPSVVVIRPVRSGGHSDGVGDKGESQDGLFVSTGADDRELL
ncbi:hypothetical protein B0T18DRAFT_63166 [Schizothecium vesticola]|uniref:Uncharacterized protein n=1 Tax=Schizothecium vesticola TaxID=314040 RepID=A0AA40F4J8_9PEZI|nr:hypothetical protein B0T18DRAFT_63166 [Schizothecium vesticola]